MYINPNSNEKFLGYKYVYTKDTIVLKNGFAKKLTDGKLDLEFIILEHF